MSEAATIGLGGLVLMLALAIPAFRETSDDDWLKKSDLAVQFLDRYGTPIGPVALDLGYQLNPARFVVQSGTCPATAASACQTTLSRLPSFQFFINLGTTF